MGILNYYLLRQDAQSTLCKILIDAKTQIIKAPVSFLTFVSASLAIFDLFSLMSK